MDYFSLLLILFLLQTTLGGSVIEFWDYPIIQTYTKCNQSSLFPFNICDNFQWECTVKIKGKCIFFMQDSGESLSQERNFLDSVIIGSFIQQEYEMSIQSQVLELNKNSLSICGDSIVSDDEECEDNNNFPFDGCFNCKFQCEEQCLICVKGLCIQKGIQVSYDIPLIQQIITKASFEVSYNSRLFEKDEISCIFKCRICIENQCTLCEDGYQLNDVTKLCETTCGDSILQGLEECDDGNQENYDGCSECKIIKYDDCNHDEYQFCSFCHYGQCLMCMSGYILQDSICQTQCGDGLVNQAENEECDNPNDVGCINCQVVPGYLCYGPTFSLCQTCDQNCDNCSSNNQKLICEKCKEGYFPVGKNCELCDSNCITCQESSFLCTSCYRNDCDFCESYEGFYTDTEAKACVSICGDGILVATLEQCDDGNEEDEDGCDSACHLEGQAIDYSNYKQIKSSGFHSFDFQMESENRKFSLDCEEVVVNIDSYDSSQFEFTSTNNQGNCRLQFKFYQSIYKFNKIHVQFTFEEAKLRLLNQSENIIQFEIEPEELIIQTDNQQNQADSISSAQQSFGLVFIILIPISIITNLFDYLWAVLEILSWINNFYFLNVHYPFNVEIFFLNSDWTSIINFPTYQGLNQPGCIYYFQAPQRFESKGINPLFLNNAQIPFMFIFSATAIYVMMKSLFLLLLLIRSKLNEKNNPKEKRFSIFHLEGIKHIENKKTEKNGQMMKNKDHKLLNSLIIQLNSIQKELKKKVKQTISLCLLDITLAIMLQINYAENLDHIVVGINQLLAVVSISLILFHLHQSYNTINIHKLLAENEYFKEKYEIYYENVNTDSAFGAKYKFFGLLRKIFYIFFTPLLQTLFCFVASNFGLALILYENPYKTKAQFTFQIISDLSLSSILLIIVLFAFNDQTQIQFIETHKITFGWIIIAFVILTLFVEISVLFYQLVKSFYSIFKLLRGCIPKLLQKREETNPNVIEQESQVGNQKLDKLQKSVPVLFQLVPLEKSITTSQKNQTR
ncbi:unnamed protein product (macronuclear) [Paramecium tetraurelia]|uniref:Insulin-like growth factor binding protein, N-terminal n=1 Tax=Paramecium tetraurelia TaxID=5888 RepID=A0BVW1_PARTE|nr:uncharacterized protein GSPATT00032530001 [Paramecium tetraurelia]CAK62678.1 unnamed protein product [Paramecium tetraurelia]|eukprot:XP_001430076.1 hypothetical protein (macronuclear) [Paramecium tetraurelia strain d4-2]